MKDTNRVDIYFRNAMLVTGSITAVLFLVSLFSMVQFPGAFNYLVIGEVAFAVIFLILRTVYRFRDSFKIKPKK